MSVTGDLASEIIAGKYELLRLLGRGGMGVVYEARHIGTRKRCAVKLLLRSELASDAEVNKRFFREARASGLIESEHVVAAYDSGIDAAGRVYYVMDCLRGEDLAHRIQRGPLTPAATIKLMAQAAAGLISAHAMGVVHRDIKPANLFLSLGPADEVKLKILDFGVAKVKMEVFDESADSYTRGGSLLGTPQYMSPEQMKRASAITESADVWSLGVVMFECLTGELPWGSVESVGELLAAILTAEVPHLQNLAPWVPPGLAAIAERALSRDHSRRMQNAAELHDALIELVPGDARLFLSELGPLSEDERGLVAPRFELADTVPIGDSASNIPVIGSVPSVNSSRLALLAGGAVIIGMGALVAGSIRWRQTAAVASATERPPPPPAAPTTQAVASVSSANPRWVLAVVPPSVRITVDGAAAAAVNGQVALDGPVGTIHVVGLSNGEQVREERVVITRDGPVPDALSLPSRRRAAPNKPHPGSASTSHGIAAPVASAELTHQTAGLSEIFE